MDILLNFSMFSFKPGNLEQSPLVMHKSVLQGIYNNCALKFFVMELSSGCLQPYNLKQIISDFILPISLREIFVQLFIFLYLTTSKQVGWFSFDPEYHIEREQMCCYLTRTTKSTHQLIKDNLHETPTYGGWVDAKGPRYCPSIEDKVLPTGVMIILTDPITSSCYHSNITFFLICSLQLRGRACKMFWSCYLGFFHGHNPVMCTQIYFFCC